MANESIITESLRIYDATGLDWVYFILAALLGSLASSLFNNDKKWTSPKCDEKDPKHQFKDCNFGSLADIVIGLTAALGILWTMTPQVYYQFIGIAAIGGYGGSSVLRGLLNRLDADKAENKAKKYEEQVKNEIKDNINLNNVLMAGREEISNQITETKNYLSKNEPNILKVLYDKGILK